MRLFSHATKPTLPVDHHLEKRARDFLNATAAPGTVLAGGDLRAAEFPVRVESDFLQPRLWTASVSKCPINRPECVRGAARGSPIEFRSKGANLIGLVSHCKWRDLGFLIQRGDPFVPFCGLFISMSEGENIDFREVWPTDLQTNGKSILRKTARN
jgi:hypothetical protein